MLRSFPAAKSWMQRQSKKRGKKKAHATGNNESAGKRKSGKTTQGNRWLRGILVQAAWAASRTKGTYLSAQYRRLAVRRGNKRAIVALAHTLLVVIFQLLKKQTNDRDLGSDYFDRLDADRLARGLVRRLEKLGHKVTLERQPGI